MRKGELRAAGDADAGVSPTSEVPVGGGDDSGGLFGLRCRASGKRNSAESLGRSEGRSEGKHASNGSNGGSGLDVSELSKFLGGNGTERNVILPQCPHRTSLSMATMAGSTLLTHTLTILAGSELSIFYWQSSISLSHPRAQDNVGAIAAREQSQPLSELTSWMTYTSTLSWVSGSLMPSDPSSSSSDSGSNGEKFVTASLIPSIPVTTLPSIPPSRSPSALPLPPSPQPWATETNVSYESSLLAPLPSATSPALVHDPNTSFEISFLQPSGSWSSFDQMSTILETPTVMTLAPPPSFPALSPVPRVPYTDESSSVHTPSS
ncbi:hypothetical protein BT96DRAFT_1005344 [Gymnopus androsaceus JB14]|uniref:Uncharacterized protein n=1 Tax=Gymnopus androsaceus JB14 TaxID=1447944 RepID=A0A6A4GNN8_9AGAR|nr:hypothetical protein BT96DRAFT_1005344 [Gymnopus androsaceus JB14]